jgi:hypothetical protein
MAEEKIENSKTCPVVPLLLGGLIGGGIALIVAPSLVRARSSVLAAANKARQMIGKKKSQSSGSDGIYCQVPEGVDICFDEEKSR